MHTIIETPIFKQNAQKIWTEEERGAFCAWLAARHDVGNVISGSGGCRKVRWSVNGAGKRGGARVIYYNRLANGEIWLLLIYTKNVIGNIPAHLLKSIQEEIDYE